MIGYLEKNGFGFNPLIYTKYSAAQANVICTSQLWSKLHNGSGVVIVVSSQLLVMDNRLVDHGLQVGVDASKVICNLYFTTVKQTPQWFWWCRCSQQPAAHDGQLACWPWPPGKGGREAGGQDPPLAPSAAPRCVCCSPVCSGGRRGGSCRQIWQSGLCLKWWWGCWGLPHGKPPLVPQTCGGPSCNLC